MNFKDAFMLGGWGMWPTLFCGILMICAATWYSIKPEKRFLPLLFSFGLMTLVSGCLGFSMGVINSLMIVDKVGPDKHYLALVGVAESLYNVVFALIFIMLSSIAAAVGAWRLSRVLSQNPDPERIPS